MTTTHPVGHADTHPSHVRPPQRWRLLGLAAVALGTLALGVGAAGATGAPVGVPLPPPPGVDPSGWNYEAATPIDCWIPQAEGWPPAPAIGTTERDHQWYAGWLATNVRQRARDGRYEVVTHTDRGSAPMCTNVLPDSPQGMWVANADVRDVQAYLLGLAGAS